MAPEDRQALLRQPRHCDVGALEDVGDGARIHVFEVEKYQCRPGSDRKPQPRRAQVVTVRASPVPSPRAEDHRPKDVSLEKVRPPQVLHRSQRPSEGGDCQASRRGRLVGNEPGEKGGARDVGPKGRFETLVATRAQSHLLSVAPETRPSCWSGGATDPHAPRGRRSSFRC